MSTYEVPRNDWRGFCRRITNRHRGARVTLELTQPGASGAITDVLARDLPLLGLDVDGDEPDEEIHVFVDVAGETVELAEPERIVLEQAGEDEPTEIAVDTREERRLLVRFAEPAIPGEMDGL